MGIKYDVISPDGFSISRENVYETKIKAFRAFLKWK